MTRLANGVDEKPGGDAIVAFAESKSGQESMRRRPSAVPSIAHEMARTFCAVTMVPSIPSDPAES